MADINYKIIKDYGTIADHNGIELKLQEISWNGYPAKLDLRAWKNGYAMGGITFTKKEADKLGELIKGLDLVRKAEVTDMPKPINITEKKSVTTVDTIEKKVPNNIIQLPLPKLDIEKMVTDGNATYEQCEEKINAEKKIYVDGDSQYVLTGILELCKVDKAFRNNVMRNDKNFAGALKYMAKMCQEGYGYKGDNFGVMDRDMGLAHTIDYFNLKPEPKPEPKKAEDKKETAKRGRKKKGA